VLSAKKTEKYAGTCEQHCVAVTSVRLCIACRKASKLSMVAVTAADFLWTLLAMA